MLHSQPSSASSVRMSVASMPRRQISRQSKDRPSLESEYDDHEPEQLSTRCLVRATHDGLKQYDVKTFVGNGCFGQVYLVQHRETGCFCACKVLLKRDREREIRREIENLRSLDHPNVIKMVHTSEDESYVFLVLELCEGGELLQLLDQHHEAGTRLSEDDVASYSQQILSALAYIHARGWCIGISSRRISSSLRKVQALQGNLSLLTSVQQHALQNAQRSRGFGGRLSMPHQRCCTKSATRRLATLGVRGLSYTLCLRV